MSVTLLPDHNDYQLIFRVYNDTTTQPSNSNPAGFLAQVTAQVAGQITSGADTLLTSSSWSYAVDPLQGVGDNTDWAALQWHSAETWAIGGNDASNGGNNIWSSVNGRPIAGISSAAQWIWGSKNGDGLFSNGVDDPQNWLFIKTTISTGSDAGAPVPEPATILVWSLLGAASWLGMRVWRGGRRIGRRLWSPENRQAILEVIGR